MLRLVVHAQSQSNPTLSRFEGGLKVLWRHTVLTANPAHQSFTGGITAYYGLSIVSADTLDLYFSGDQRYAVASGHVQILDPQATATADFMRFDWLDKSAQLSNVHLVTPEGLRMDAGSADVTKDLWTLEDARLANEPGKRAVLSVSAKRISIIPGVVAKTQKARLWVLGIELPPLPKHDLRLDESRGIEWPLPSYRNGAGWGFGWRATKPIGDRTAVRAFLSSYPNLLPSYGAMLTMNIRSHGQAHDPGSELDERFAGSYFENVNVRSIDGDAPRRTPIRTLSWAASYNRSMRQLDPNGTYNLRQELTYHDAGPLGPMGYTVEGRWQDIQRLGSQYQRRTMIRSSLASPIWAVGPQWAFSARADGEAFAGRRHFSWTRGTIGARWQPDPTVAFGAAYASATKSGVPDYPIDDLLTTRTLNLRADARIGPWRAYYLDKFNPSSKRWYDREYRLEQIAGPTKFYVIYRQSTHSYRVGVLLRLDEAFAKAAKREHERQRLTSEVESEDR